LDAVLLILKIFFAVLDSLIVSVTESRLCANAGRNVEKVSYKFVVQWDSGESGDDVFRVVKFVHTP
jgi:hypothetical protein